MQDMLELEYDIYHTRLIVVNTRRLQVVREHRNEFGMEKCLYSLCSSATVFDNSPLSTIVACMLTFFSDSRALICCSLASLCSAASSFVVAWPLSLSWWVPLCRLACLGFSSAPTLSVYVCFSGKWIFIIESVSELRTKHCMGCRLCQNSLSWLLYTWRRYFITKYRRYLRHHQIHHFFSAIWWRSRCLQGAYKKRRYFDDA